MSIERREKYTLKAVPIKTTNVTVPTTIPAIAPVLKLPPPPLDGLGTGDAVGISGVAANAESKASHTINATTSKRRNNLQRLDQMWH